MRGHHMSTDLIFIKKKPAKNQDQVFAYLEGGHESRSHVSAQINGKMINFNDLPMLSYHFCTEEDSFVLHRDDWGAKRKEVSYANRRVVRHAQPGVYSQGFIP